jgi:two-component system, NarL family, invasion response regulator UvrY
MDGTITVLLADDHEVVRTGYRRLLETEGDIVVVAEASNGREAYLRYVDTSPDVVVMDLTMPETSGFEVSRRILSRDADARILVFSVHETGAYLSQALNLGILGYISKRSASRVMVEAVRAVAKGERFIGEELRRHLADAESAAENHALDRLSPREFEVFCQLARGRSVEEIAEMLNISPKTVGNHYTQVKRKLNAANVAALTLMAVRAGVIDH